MLANDFLAKAGIVDAGLCLLVGPSLILRGAPRLRTRVGAGSRCGNGIRLDGRRSGCLRGWLTRLRLGSLLLHHGSWLRPRLRRGVAVPDGQAGDGRDQCRRTGKNTRQRSPKRPARVLICHPSPLLLLPGSAYSTLRRWLLPLLERPIPRRRLPSGWSPSPAQSLPCAV